MADLAIQLTSGKIVDVKLSKIKPEGVKEPVIVKRDQDGDLILKKRKTDTGQVFDKFSWITVNANGEEYEPEKITSYEVLEDGTEEVVRYPLKTKRVTFSLDNTLPVTYAGRLLPEASYEMYALDDEGVMDLYNEMEVAIDKDLMFVASPFVWKRNSKISYHACFLPYRTEDGKFGFTMMTTKGRIKYKHAMRVVEAVELDKVATLKTLESLTSILEISGK